MSNASKAARRAAYTLHQRGEAPRGFDHIYALRKALQELPGAREYFEYYWGYRPHPEALSLDVRVYEAAGRRRIDLEDPLNPIYTRHRGGQFWDEDFRPRGEPVPGTGRRGPYCYFRYPRTQRDRRLGYPLAEEGEPRIRGQRAPHMLPTCWEDLPRRSWRDRNWKRFRAKQWR